MVNQRGGCHPMGDGYAKITPLSIRIVFSRFVLKKRNKIVELVLGTYLKLTRYIPWSRDRL